MIFFETTGQGKTFLLLLYAGFGAGLLYDLLMLPRRFLPRFCWPVLDALWCFATGAAVAAALALGGEHRVRLYAFLGLIGGAAIYAFGIRSLICGIVRQLKKKKTNQTEQADSG